MSVAIMFQIYFLLSTLLVGADTMEQQHCFTQEDKLWIIDGYANFVKSSDAYYKFVETKQLCMFNNTPWLYMSTVNVTNVSNGTFVPEFDRYRLQIAIDTKGKFK